MDHTEDLSARVLLKHILTTEPPRTPVTRSTSKAPADTTARRASSRPENKNAGAQTPQDMLRRSLRHKLRESITRKSLRPPKRRTASVVLKKINTPAATSMLFDDGDTPRHILMNILKTEPVRTPVVHEKAASEEPQVPSADSSIARRSTELSGFDLPDLTIGNVISTAKGLSRKRPRRSLNVTAFEKRLRDGEDVEEQSEESLWENSSLSLSSSTSLSLKTPFVDVHTEKRGLQRRVSNRRKITEEAFGAAVNKRHMGELSSIMQADQGPSETAFSEGFTLGLSKLSEPDITADIVHCNTALYAQPDATATNHSMIATQDKPTVMASQLQRQILELEDEEEQSQLRKERSMYAFPTEDIEKDQEEEPVSESRNKEEGRAADEAVTQEEDMAKSKVDNGGATAEDEEAVEVQTEEEEVADSQTEEEEDGRVDDEPEKEVQLDTLPQEEGEEAEEDDDQPEKEEGELQTESVTQEEEGEEEDGGADDESEKEEDEDEDEDEDEVEVQTESQSQEEEGGIGSQSDREEAVDSQTEEEEIEPESQDDGEATSQTGEGEEEEEEEKVASQIEGGETLPDSQNPVEEDQNEEEEAADSPSEEEADDYLAEEENTENKSAEEDPAEVEMGEEEGVKEEEEEGDVELASTDLDVGVEHISRRAHHSEAGLFVPASVDDKNSEDLSGSRLSGGKSKEHPTFDVYNDLEMESHDSGPAHAGTFDVPESSNHGQTDASSKEPELDADKENFTTPDRVRYGIQNNQPPEEASSQEEEWEEDDHDVDEEEETEDIPSKTPAFVRQKISVLRPDPQASPSVLKKIQASSTDVEGLAEPQPKQVKKRRSGPPKKKREGGLPKSYLMGIFKHFAQAKVSADVYPVLQEVMDKFFSRLAEDLETYAVHAKRKTIEVEDAELLLRRQGHVNDKVPVEVLIEKYLRMDQRRLLIPVATSGNFVFPKKRR